MTNRKLTGLLQATALSIALCVPALFNPLHADDTEIYTAALSGGFSEQITPNILYVIDTSGSMDTSPGFPIPPDLWYEAAYDASAAYPVPTVCQEDMIYRITATAAPPQIFDAEYGYPLEADGRDYRFQNCNSLEFAFPLSTLVCSQALADLQTRGWYRGRIAEFAPYAPLIHADFDGKWGSLDRDLGGEESVVGQMIWRECPEDRGVHGPSASSSDKWPVNPEDDTASSLRDGYSSTIATAPSGFTGANDQIIASGHFLNWLYAVRQNRMTAVQIALRSVIRDLPDDTNVGLMRFDTPRGGGGDSTEGGMMAKEFVRIGVGTNRQDMINAVLTELGPNGPTPLAETLLESLYAFSGGAVYFGAVSEDEAGTSRSVPASRNPDDSRLYKSPIEFTCQPNAVVYFTDGAPTGDENAYDGASEARAATGFDGGMEWLTDIEDHIDAVVDVTPGYGCDGDSNDMCMPALARYMQNEDIAPGTPGTQKITVHTIGFDPAGSTSSDPPDPDYLRAAAVNGGGLFHEVTDAQQLRDAFQVTTRAAVSADTAFTAPALAVNAFNRTRDENRVYFAMFRSSTSPGWGGNLKAYQFGTAGGNVVITDANENPAIDPDNGQFHFDARSIWSAAADGNVAPVGGAASRLPAARNIYTWFGDNTARALRAAAYEFTPGNSAITTSMLGMTGTESFTRETLINWMRGVDVLDADGDGSTTDQRLHMGDPLHSRPNVVTYGGTAGAPEQRIFLTTNDGFLHVVDASNGTETFAFIADETLRNAKRIFTNGAGSSAGKAYGLDGVPVLHVDEGAGEDPGVSGDDKVYLYTGMRRGGRSYYAFDFTNPDDPEVLWRIQGGDLNGNGTADAGEEFYHLGYTFSTPRVGEIKIGGAIRKILVFGGGYDLDKDFPEHSGSTRDSYREDAYGNAIYIVDALTGDRLWWASSTVDGEGLAIPEMVNSIPSDVSLVDSDNDGWSDRIYVGDTGGRIFRIDINEFSPGGSVQSWGGMIADLGASAFPDDTDTAGDENVQNNRKFFYAPDVSIVENGHDDYLAVAIGSGNRAHPSYPITGDTATQDVFFVLKDPHILRRPPGDNYDYGIVFDNTLFDAGTNGLLSDDADVRGDAEDALRNSKGWYLKMEHPGEKVLAESTTFNYTVTFTSFEPEDVDLSNCQARTGIGRLYALNLRNGNPVFANFDGADGLGAGDRSLVLTRDGIPPTPTVTFPDANGGEPLLMAGPEIIPADFGGNLRRSYWMIPEPPQL